MYKNLTTVCCAAVLAFGLAACGGGDDEEMAEAPMVEEPMEPTPAEQLAAAQMAVATAQAAVDALTSASTPAEIATANSALASALAQLATASAIPANQITLLRQQIAALQMQLADLEQEIADERGASEAAQMAVTDATSALEAAQTAEMAARTNLDTATANLATAAANLAAAAPGSEAQAMAVVAYNTALAAVTSATSALQVETDKVTAATEALSAANMALAEIDPNHVALAAARAALAKAEEDAKEAADEIQGLKDKVAMLEQAEADRKAAQDEADAIEAAKPDADDNNMAYAMALGGAALPARQDIVDLNDPATPNDFTDDTDYIDDMGMLDDEVFEKSNGAYTRTTEADGDTPASTDTVVIYNDQGEPTPTAYSSVYLGNTSVADNTWLNAIDAATGVLTFETNGNVGKLVVGMFFDAIPNDGSRTLSGDDDDTTEAVTENEVMGTFDGVAGTYACGATGSTCSASRSATGVLSLGAGWTFSPTLTGDTPSARGRSLAALRVDVPDRDYLHWGYWVNSSTNDDDKPVYKISAFFGGTVETPIASAQSADLHGSAKYSGPATGAYVRKEFDDGGDPEHIWHGKFTASASLTAYFGGGDVAANKQHTIDGEVTGFMDADGNAIDDTWSVTLKSTPFDSTDGSFDTRNANIFNGETEGDKGMAGNWQGQFFGEVVNDTDTVEDGNQSQLPSGVAGQFNGHFVNGHVLGGFGAQQDKE